jgi:hypothetical protein
MLVLQTFNFLSKKVVGITLAQNIPPTQSLAVAGQTPLSKV